MPKNKLRAASWCLLALAFFLLSLKPAFACRCADPAPVDSALNYADMVFWGEVISTSIVPLSSLLSTPTLDSIGQDVVRNLAIRKSTFRVISWIKARKSLSQISIYTAASSAACGFNFQSGMKYLVFADRQAYLKPLVASRLRARVLPTELHFPPNWTNACTRTTREVQAELDLINGAG